MLAKETDKQTKKKKKESGAKERSLYVWCVSVEREREAVVFVSKVESGDFLPTPPVFFFIISPLPRWWVDGTLRGAGVAARNRTNPTDRP